MGDGKQARLSKIRHYLSSFSEVPDGSFNIDEVLCKRERNFISCLEVDDGCFECGDPGHWNSIYPWVDNLCTMRGCGQRMKLLTSGKAHSLGHRFLKCKYGAFKWVNESKPKEDGGQASSSSTGASAVGGTLKLTRPGVNPMVVKGSLNDITELMRRLKS